VHDDDGSELDDDDDDDDVNGTSVSLLDDELLIRSQPHVSGL
jgi:hypothetical protein